jgi:hypothetical protein
VTYRTEEYFDDTPEREPKRRLLFPFVISVLLAAAGSGSALAWRAGLPGFPNVTSVASAPAAAPAADKAVGLKDFQVFQQQIAGSLQASERLLTAQQAEIKRLSEQVSALTAKLDLLQHPVASAQAALPASAAKPVRPAPRNKPPESKPAGAISTGGAPLPPPVQLPR